MSMIFLGTDYCIYLLLILIIALGYISFQREHLKKIWGKIFSSKLAVLAAMMLCIFFITAFLDSIHFKVAGATKVISVLDIVLSPTGAKYESTYSTPFAKKAFVKTTVISPKGNVIRNYHELKHIQPEGFTWLVLKILFYTVLIWGVTFIVYKIFYDYFHYGHVKGSIAFKKSNFKHGFFLSSLFFLMLLLSALLILSKHYHILGTTKVGLDVFYEAVKSIRTGVLIGSITTLFMIPLAIAFGITAGYFGGFIDDIIQYIYTTLSSIPGVLLIAASILSLQVFISNHPDVFKTIIERADARLLALCIILGITSWTGLCRLLRAETLKVREYDFVMAARSLGVSDVRIILRHVLPNVMHIILISVVLDFSGLVLAEAVLSYVGVGVDPSMMSWGNMINSARLELARSPIVWWPLLSAFIFMFALVLSANVFAEKVREAFDPRN